MEKVTRLCSKKSSLAPKIPKPLKSRAPGMYKFGAKTTFPGRPKAKVSCQGRLGAARAQPWVVCYLHEILDLRLQNKYAPIFEGQWPIQRQKRENLKNLDFKDKIITTALFTLSFSIACTAGLDHKNIKIMLVVAELQVNNVWQQRM